MSFASVETPGHETPTAAERVVDAARDTLPIS
jgi:hypothetical protein